MASVSPIRKELAMRTIGELADLMQKNREDRKAIDEKVKAYNTAYDVLEAELIDALDSQKSTRGDGKKASVSISESVVPAVKDWDALWAFIFKGKHKQLMQLRISAPAWRELCELKKPPPGIESFTKRTINLTTKK